MAPKKSGVLFINKSIESKNLSRSDGAEKSQIFSHVQNRLPIAISHSPGLPNLCEVEAISWSASSSGSEKCKHANSKLRRPKPCKKSRKKVLALAIPDLVKLHSPLVTVSVEEVDPFGCTVAPMDRYMSTVLEFYSGTMLENVFPSKLLADISRQHTLSYASEDAVCLNAILCTTAGAMYERSGEFKHGYSAMYFKGQAICHLKQELAKSGSCTFKVSTLYAVSLLLWIECLQGDVEAVEAHVEGLNRLVSLAGGIRDSPLPVLTTILSSSYYCAAMLRARPVLEPPKIAERDITSTELECLYTHQQGDFQSPGSRFFQLDNLVTVGSNLLQLIAEQRSCNVSKQRQASGYAPAGYDDLERMYLGQMSTEYHLLEMPFSDFSSDMTPQQDAIRIAVYVSSVPIIAFAPQTSAFSRSMAEQLKAALERTDLSTLWHSSCDMLLWVLFIAAELSFGQEEWHWLTSHIANIVVLLDLRSATEMEHILMGFHYVPIMFDSTLNNIWRDVEVILCAPNKVTEYQ